MGSVVIGSVNSALRDVFTKLAKLQTKNNFSFAIIAGDLFGDGSTEKELEDIAALLQGTISVPLPTYFTVGGNRIPERVVERLESTDEVCTNLYYLGRRGTLKTSEGIRIVTLGGKFENSGALDPQLNDKYQPYYTEPDARSLYGAHSADILVTYQWPSSIRTGTKVNVPENIDIPQSHQCLADLCSTLKPRYYFSSSTNLFFEREPFFYMPTDDAPNIKPTTRFISLASFNNSSTQKWLYAFSLDPKAPPPLSLPVGTTASPLANVAKKRQALPDQRQSYSRFSQDTGYDRPNKRHRQRQPPPGPGECFFCLSNENLATHLVASIGTDAYLTTAKGPLTTSSTFPSLEFPCHILIIPLTHSPTIEAIPESATRSSAYQEMQRYRDALHEMIQRKSEGKLGSVTWEISRSRGIHIHWQFMPVTADLVSRGLVEAAFKVEAENAQYPKFEAREIGDGSAERSDFFRVWIRDPSTEHGGTSEANGVGKRALEKSLVLPVSFDFRFDLQFGRRVMAKLLQLENRVNWQDGGQSQAEEEADAEAFRKAFKVYDFSLEEG